VIDFEQPINEEAFDFPERDSKTSIRVFKRKQKSIKINQSPLLDIN